MQWLVEGVAVWKAVGEVGREREKFEVVEWGG